MNVFLKQRVLDYFEILTGERLDLVEETGSVLPLFLRERYTLFSTRLFGRRCLLAIEVGAWENGSPSGYGKHSDALALKLGEPVILVLSNLPSHARNRMVRRGIPFIVPGSQTFIPNGMIDLRERFPQPSSKPSRRLSPAAQCTVLFHLLRESLAATPLKTIAQKVHYSPMMMTKVKDELEGAKLCSTGRTGRATTLNLAASNHSLWEQAKPRMSSPVKRRTWVRWDGSCDSVLLAGISALSELTLIADDRLPTYALPLEAFRDCLAKGICTECRDPDDATARVEVWSYDPRLLSSGRWVDPLSLYLSLRHSADERVQQQLEHLLEGITW